MKRLQFIPMAGGGWAVYLNIAGRTYRGDFERWGACFVTYRGDGPRSYWSPDDSAAALCGRLAHWLGTRSARAGKGDK